MKKSNEKLGIYIHIPFCAHKCRYCGFVSFDDQSSYDKERYFNALLHETEMRAEQYKDRIADTIYIGGGTPTILPCGYIKDLMDLIKERFSVSEDSEITIEANPGTLTPEKLEVYRKAGINRLSIGAQSMDDMCLKKLGRIHDRKKIMETYGYAREAGFDNINLDLMFSIPGQTDEIWEGSLREVIALRPEHISLYSLQIEEGTEFYELYKNGRLKIADDEDDRKRYHRAVEILTGEGFRHYEISNASLPGRESKHNLKYWSLDEYLGLGLAAHSFTDGKRFYNTADPEEYIKCISASEFPSVNDEICSINDLVFEYVFTGLRKTEGIDLSDFRERFGVPFSAFYREKLPYIEENIKNGYMFFEDEGSLGPYMGSGHLGLTLKGIDISNGIMAEFAL